MICHFNLKFSYYLWEYCEFDSVIYVEYISVGSRNQLKEVKRSISNVTIYTH